MNKHKKRCLSYIQAYISFEDRSCPRFRGFVDEWYAHHMGLPFLTKNKFGGQARWLNNPDISKPIIKSCMRSLHVVSVQALKVLDGKVDERLIKEHAIPIKKLRDLAFEKLNSNSQTEDIEQFLLTYYRVAAITKKEDVDINEEGFRDCMPIDWDNNESESIYARYDEANIRYQVNPIEAKTN